MPVTTTLRRAMRVTVLFMLLAGLQAAPGRAFAIENGDDADPAASQFVAYLKSDTAFVPRTGRVNECTGTLVAPRLVLTAAHCVTTMRPGDWSVTFGHETDNAATYGVAQVVKHSEDAGAWAANENPTSKVLSRNDLAVIQLDKSVNNRVLVQLDSGTDTLSRAHMTWGIEYGYGDTSGSVNGEGDGKLKEGRQLMLAPDRYREATDVYGARPTPPAIITAADPGYDPLEGPTGRCKVGDSGGPFMLDSGSGPVQVGVLSIIPPFESAGGVWACHYTRIDNGDPYRAWLDAKIAQLGNS